MYGDGADDVGVCSVDEAVEEEGLTFGRGEARVGDAVEYVVADVDKEETGFVAGGESPVGAVEGVPAVGCGHLEDLM